MPEFRVALRHTTLVEAAVLQPADDDSHFIATAAPPPTHSILTLHHGDETQYFLVDRAIEVEASGQERGIYGRLTDAEAHTEASKLGTEHLEDGEMIVDEDGAAPKMAMPAPVVDPDPTEEVDLDERRRLEAIDGESADTESPSGDNPPLDGDVEAASPTDVESASDGELEAESESESETEATPDGDAAEQSAADSDAASEGEENQDQGEGGGESEGEGDKSQGRRGRRRRGRKRR